MGGGARVDADSQRKNVRVAGDHRTEAARQPDPDEIHRTSRLPGQERCKRGADRGNARRFRSAHRVSRGGGERCRVVSVGSTSQLPSCCWPPEPMCCFRLYQIWGLRRFTWNGFVIRSAHAMLLLVDTITPGVPQIKNHSQNESIQPPPLLPLDNC